MTRVGFVLEDHTWLGGVNYYRNLFSALSLLPDPWIKPVIFIGSQASPSVIERLQFCEVVKTDAFNHRGPLAVLRKGTKRLLGQRDLYLRALLARHRIDVLSHAATLVSSSSRAVILSHIDDPLSSMYRSGNFITSASVRMLRPPVTVDPALDIRSRIVAMS